MLRAIDRSLRVLLQSACPPTTTGFAIVFTPESESRIVEVQTQAIALLEQEYGLSLSPRFCETARVHVTLVQQVSDAADGGAIARAAAAALTGATVEIESIHVQAPNWLFLNVRLGPCIRAAHVACADLCSNHMSGTTRTNASDTTQEAKMRARYSYRYMYDAYTIPHITLGVLSDAEAFDKDRRTIMVELDEILHAVFGNDRTLHVKGVTHYTMSQDGKGSHARTLCFEPVLC